MKKLLLISDYSPANRQDSKLFQICHKSNNMILILSLLANHIEKHVFTNLRNRIVLYMLSDEHRTRIAFIVLKCTCICTLKLVKDIKSKNSSFNDI